MALKNKTSKKPEYYAFTQQVLDIFFDGDNFNIDLSDIQEIALATNVIKQVEVSEPCADECNCAIEIGEFPTKCNRRNFGHDK